MAGEAGRSRHFYETGVWRCRSKAVDRVPLQITICLCDFWYSNVLVRLSEWILDLVLRQRSTSGTCS